MLSRKMCHTSGNFLQRFSTPGYSRIPTPGYSRVPTPGYSRVTPVELMVSFDFYLKFEILITTFKKTFFFIRDYGEDKKLLDPHAPKKDSMVRFVIFCIFI